MDILKFLLKGENSVGDISISLNIRQPKVSLMLKELRELKLVNVRVDVKMRYYSINRLVLNAYIDDIKKMLSDFEVNDSNEIIVRRKVLFSN